MKVAVIGAGAWGSTLVGLAKENGHSVKVWSRQSPHSLEQVIDGANLVVSAISMKGVRSVISQLKSLSLSPDTIFITATKGLDPSGTELNLPRLPSQLWQSAFPTHAVAILSGPNLSKEIQHGLPAASVIASKNLEAAKQVQVVLSSSRFRIYTNSDPLGVELGGALKNVIAIAVGACDGLQLGTNAKAALVTRGLAEMIRIGTYWGAKAETFYGLSGLGDLLATCNSALSRNYQVGYGLAQGKTLEEVLSQLEGTAEGVNTTHVLIRLADQQNISVPISFQVHQLLQREVTPQAAVAALMLRDSKPEV
ncbi:NAD(P)H-dependent glycerol-3-phosphate dehydrogenase [Phormidesmis priestleyi ULC007]|uniref:Glycerol-3-phosphate dehydrogenase [NAD(P)+] n=1 Tax=Phormidesmis priestleyi ULC007 TaxID=1920490 RepID=A0A2T1D5S8_9CYAN|nr:NAD(P)H-dependent glycerol-3-phosphate dehydrogenase [Phormidesmis priestleyi]PSB15840.1 NAD(P)H-dependent glycerol-3-phosphate dehydrogenase [Phormidesmis priestleyi ULC007]PZO46120.1 MAG: NAD(P)H-dependent glycerol-3-phosphate dehydrogenase [Phormidesmis priestleyi]